MIQIGHMAKTYGLLPSEIIDRATTFDIMVTDVYSTWEKNEMMKASGKVSADMYSQDQLKEILEKTRSGG